MGPIVSKVIKVKGQIYVVALSVGHIFVSVCSLLPPGPWPDLHQTSGY